MLSEVEASPIQSLGDVSTSLRFAQHDEMLLFFM